MGIIIKMRSLISLHRHYRLLLPSCTLPSPTKPLPTTTTGPVRLVSPDGHVQRFHHPVPVSQVLNNHPFHLVCRSDAFFIGQVVPTLSPDDRLEPGHCYFLLPSQFFMSKLSFVTLSGLLVVSNSNKQQADHAAAATLRGFEVRKTEKGMLQVRLRDETMNEKVLMEEEDEEEEMKGRICTSEELEKEYRGFKGRPAWKPSLETIGEITCNGSKSRRRGVFVFITRKKRKKKMMV